MQLVIVTGLSGAGKSQALNIFEDLGYYCIDNMPPALIGNFVDLMKYNKLEVDKAAICIDVRTGGFLEGITDKLKNIRGIDYKILFLEASDEVLVRRFGETRRTHPLSETSVISGLTQEKELLEKVREAADYIIDTSNMKTALLKRTITEIVTSEKDENVFILNISSFGYKHGIAREADIVFDMRFIPNPYYVPSLKDLTGNSKKVSSYVLRQEITSVFMKYAVPMIEELIPAYMKEGKYSLNVAFGCTGGHHRSVASANEIGRIFKEKGFNVSITHRDL